MNCKPKDIAVIVANEWTESAGICGRYVRVLHCRHNQNGDPAWTYEGEPMFDRVSLRIGAMCGLKPSESRIDVIPDAYLRPIPPGEVSDSEVTDLYEPTHRELA